MLAKNEFFKVSVGFILPKKSPLKPLIDQKSTAYHKTKLFYLKNNYQKLNLNKFINIFRLLQMIESGLIEHWRKRLWPSTHQCDPANKKNGPRRLNLLSFQSHFLIWGIGSALALASFIVEKI